MEFEKFYMLAWKVKYNAEHHITRSRCMVQFGTKYYCVDGMVMRNNLCIEIKGDNILYNARVMCIPIDDKKDIDNYISSIPGRHHILFDPNRSTEMNIMLHRVKLEVETLILTYISQFKSLYHEFLPVNESDRDKFNPIPHNRVHTYGDDYDDIDTNSSLDGSMCVQEAKGEI